jgi:lysozyme family protein
MGVDMDRVHEIARGIVIREGGFVEDPNDPGGATKHGVTIHTLRRLGLDLDGDGDVDRSDVQRVSVALAEEIFLKEYFERPKIGLLPTVLQASVFDMQVNAGAQAVRLLQRLVSKMGFPCAVDGVIGPKTAAAVQSAYAAAPDHLADAYGIERRNYYFSLGDRRPSARKYCVSRAGGKGGWIRRAEEFIAPKFHLTRKEFRERIAAWG